MKKSELNDAIAALVGFKSPKMSTGSTESKKLFLQVNQVLGLGLDVSLSKPELAREIVEIGGQTWSPMCESRGSTVTKVGLEMVLSAVEALVRQ